MIILCLIVTVLGFSYFNILGTKKWSKAAMVVFGGLFVLSLVVVVANDRNHFGMEKKTEVKRLPLISSTPGKGEVLTYEAAGTKGEKIYFYRTEKDPKKQQHTGSKNVTNQVSYSHAKAELEKKETLWVYKNDFYKKFFAIVKNNHQLVEEKNSFELTNKWTSQAIKVPTKAKTKEHEKSKK